ncbi:MAG TPA: bifunctional nicotinamidase/pyrazinamidase [Pirellulales bacterium]|nr:bifunctional nicotinamidase/pyrazinamidase [Pirellulales bacterium]
MQSPLSGTALLLVDLQNDFLPGGALPVPDGDAILPVANRLQAHFDLVIATQDWHPPNHVSFAASHPGKRVGDAIEMDGTEQRLWPVHCVQNTHGAALAGALDTRRIAHVVQKGTDPSVDSYSGFFDFRGRATSLADYLRQRGAYSIYLVGLATDYCVKATALDARRLGLGVVLVADGCRGVDAATGDVGRALDDMANAGVLIGESRGLFGS